MVQGDPQNSLAGQERWQQNIGTTMPLARLTPRSGQGGRCHSQKGTWLLRRSRSLAGKGTRTQNNLDTMPHTSPQEPDPYLATHLLCSRCWQPAGQAPNLLPPRPQTAPAHARLRGTVRDTPHVQGQPNPPGPWQPALSSPLFPNDLFSPSSQQGSTSLSGSCFTRISHITYFVI